MPDIKQLVRKLCSDRQCVCLVPRNVLNFERTRTGVSTTAVKVPRCWWTLALCVVCVCMCVCLFCVCECVCAVLPCFSIERVNKHFTEDQLFVCENLFRCGIFPSCVWETWTFREIYDWESACLKKPPSLNLPENGYWSIVPCTSDWMTN